MTSSVIQESVCSNGCFVLGKEGPCFNRYTTRYRLERKKPFDKSDTRWRIPCPSVLRNAWCSVEDCIDTKDIVWRQEVSLGALHVLVVVFGAVDACLDLRFKVHAHAHLVLCALATVLATLQMAGRVTSLRILRDDIFAFEMLATQDDNDAVSIMMAQLTAVKRQFNVFGICAIILNVVLLSVFYLSLHLGWTLLSNNLFLVVVGFLHHRASERIQKTTQSCNEDTQKIILFEALLLLRERLSTAKAFTSAAPPSTPAPAPGPAVAPPQPLHSSSSIPDHRRQVYETTSIDRFLTAVRHTSCCRKPEHIRQEHEVERKDQMDYCAGQESLVSIISGRTRRQCNEEHLSCV